jgi:hypothetical protein
MKPKLKIKKSVRASIRVAQPCSCLIAIDF